MLQMMESPHWVVSSTLPHRPTHLTTHCTALRTVHCAQCSAPPGHCKDYLRFPACTQGGR
jgi:hypothetical protein